MNQLQKLTVEKVQAAFPSGVSDIVEFRDELTLVIDMAQLLPIVRMLRADEALQYNFLEDIVADDYYPDYPRFFVSYHLYSLSHKQRVRLRVEVEDPDEGPDTLEPVWTVASWLELEVWDLMGIRFKGHGGLRRLFLPEDWQGHPLRKDYPLGYEEVQFSFNYEEIDRRKPYAKD
jgi:NADH-quinone oxidoreductase subunit C